MVDFIQTLMSVPMFVFIYPLLFGVMLTGLAAGVAVGKRLSGRWSGGLSLGLVLGLIPLVAAYFLFAHAIESWPKAHVPLQRPAVPRLLPHAAD